VSARSIVLAASGLLVAGSLGAWLLTGAEGYTRWPNEKLASSDLPPPPDEADLLSDIGFADGPTAESMPTIKSRFALGLVPGGLDAPHLLSVATLVVAALVASATAAAASRMAHRSDSSTSAAA